MVHCQSKGTFFNSSANSFQRRLILRTTSLPDGVPGIAALISSLVSLAYRWYAEGGFSGASGSSSFRFRLFEEGGTRVLFVCSISGVVDVAGCCLGFEGAAPDVAPVEGYRVGTMSAIVLSASEADMSASRN